MRKVIHKTFWAWQAEKEEAWLNEMAAKGLGLVSVGFCRYEFEDCTPGEYQYRIELMKYTPTHPESQQYIKFIEDTGAEQIGSYMRWVYFRKKAELGSFTLYSDCASRVKHLGRIMGMLIPVTIYDLWVGFYNLSLYFANRMTVSLVCACICLLAAALMGYAIFRLQRMQKHIKEEARLYE
jgi:ABC-type glycerol-3-phosphate transport system permease component